MKRLRTHLTLLPLCLLLLPGAAAAQDVPEGSPEAVAEFAEGMKLYVATEYDDALNHFIRAHGADPSFVVALFYAGLMERNRANFERADSFYALAAAQKDRLSPYYRERIATGLALNEMDAAAGLERARALAVRAPGTKAVYNYGLYAQRMNRPREAIAALETLDRTREPMKGWLSYWSVLANAQHMVGEHAASLETIEDWSRRFDQPLHLQRAVAFAALGKVDEARAQTDAATAEDQSGGWNSPQYVAALWGELDAHGNADAARQVRRDFLRDHEELAREGSATDRSWYAWTLYGDGRDEEAGRIYEELAEAEPTSVYYMGMLGVLAARRGDPATAREVDRQLAERDRAAPRSGAVGWRANITAALGDGPAALGYLREHMGRGLVYSSWWHRDPTWIALAKKDPAVARFFQGEG